MTIVEPQVPDFVPEEALRFKSPTKVSVRIGATNLGELGGVTVPAGSTLILLLSAGDHDPRQFACRKSSTSTTPNAGARGVRARRGLLPGRSIPCAPKGVSPSSACSTDSTTSGSRRNTTGHRTRGATTPLRGSSSWASTPCTSTSALALLGSAAKRRADTPAAREVDPLVGRGYGVS